MIKNRYRILGSEEAPIVCDWCGKQHVTRYWAVEDTLTGGILRCGSVCIRNALQVTVKEFNAANREASTAIRNRYHDRIAQLQKEATVLVDKWRHEENGGRCGFCPDGHPGAVASKREGRLKRRMLRELSRLVPLRN